MSVLSKPERPDQLAVHAAARGHACMHMHAGDESETDGNKTVNIVYAVATELCLQIRFAFAITYSYILHFPLSYFRILLPASGQAKATTRQKQTSLQMLCPITSTYNQHVMVPPPC